MDRTTADMLSEYHIDIIPPERDVSFETETVTCPCCQKRRPASWMDEDGCGICNECLAP